MIAIAVVILVAVSLKRRPSATVQAPIARTDPKAVVESAGGQTIRLNKEREEIRINYDKLLTYADGSSRMLGVRVVTERAGGRTFTMTGKESAVARNESDVSLTGSVRVVASDGLVLTTESATYGGADGIVRAPGIVEFSRGRMSGSGLGFSYDKNKDFLSISDRALMRTTPGEDGTGRMEIAAGALEFSRGEKIVRFQRQMKATTDSQVIEADSAVAHLSQDEERIEAMELRGRATITAVKAEVGGLQTLSGRDMDLKYAVDGRALEHAVINGEAGIQLAGEARQAGRQINANVIEVALAAGGTTPTLLTARDNVKVVIPGEQKSAARTITAQTLDSRGDEQHGLTTAHFSGTVQFSERGANVNRTARSGTLDVSVTQGFGSIDDARFARAVRFEDRSPREGGGLMTATSAAARYVLSGGLLELTGTEPGSVIPRIVNEQITVEATRIDVALAGPSVKAAGAVKSVLQPKDDRQGRGEPGAHLPSMLKQDQPVNVTADSLAYDGDASTATYTGTAQLWQGDTSVKASAITIDNKSGDLTAGGGVTTATMLVQQDKSGTRTRLRSIGTAKDFKYEESARRATYTGEAHITGPQGDLNSPRVELYLKPSGDELDRAEAYEAVTLRADNRKTSGVRLTYFAADERYLVTGAPVTIVDECGRETVGRQATYYKASERVVVDGNEQSRTQTTGKSNCP